MKILLPALLVLLLLLAAPTRAGIVPVASSDDRFGDEQLTTYQITQTLSAYQLKLNMTPLQLVSIRRALDAWYRRFPSDPLLARDYARLCQLLANLPMSLQQRYDAVGCAREFGDRFPDTSYGATLGNLYTQNTQRWSTPSVVTTRVSYGGINVCSYNAMLSTRTFVVQSDAKGSAINGTLEIEMAESTVGVCPYPPIPSGVLRYTLDEGRFGSDLTVLHFLAEKGNSPVTTADFTGHRIDDSTIDGTLTLERIDSSDAVNWSATFPVRLTESLTR